MAHTQAAAEGVRVPVLAYPVLLSLLCVGALFNYW